MRTALQKSPSGRRSSWGAPRALLQRSTNPLPLPSTLAAPVHVQTKLTVNTPGDKYEQEADRVAEQVMRMPEPKVQRQCACGKGSAEGECTECKKKKQEATGSLQRVASSPVGGIAAPPIVNEVLNTPGSPLPTATRSFMESRFGQDFSHVSVHTDQQAADSAAAVQARAYTVGHKIVFGRGESPARDSRLLAHELTHVLQQSGQAMGTVQRYQLEGPWNVNDPVHEVLTLVAVREALSKLPKSRSFNADTGEYNDVESATPGSLLKDVKKSSLPQDSSRSAHNLDPKDIDHSAQQFVRGVVFPDDPKGLLFDDPKGTTNYSSGIKWKSEFDEGIKGQFKSDKSDLIARSHFGDLQFFHGMASKDGESILDTKRQVLEWSDFLLKISTGELEGKTKIGEDGFASRMFPGNKEMSLNEFFGLSGMDSTALRQRAFGALSHLIQDSHAEGHTERDSKGEITQFHSYSSQDSHKHDDKDAWGKGKTLAEHIQNTPGAGVAIQQCAEVLIKIDQGESREAILTYLDTIIFKLSPKGTTAGPGKKFEKNVPRGKGEQKREVGTGGINRAEPRIQPKLTVNTPGNKYEQEADRVAEQVMRMPEPQVQRQCSCGKSSTEGECSECKKKKREATASLQRVASSPIGGMAAPPIVDSVLSSPGSPLPTTTRSFMEARFGQDFSHVRVHTDQRAAESATAVQARAYTVGNNIVFGQGESPTRDRQLLAHELTHVVQQGFGGQSTTLHREETNPIEVKKDPIAEAREAAFKEVAEIETNWKEIRNEAQRFNDLMPWITNGDAVLALIRDHTQAALDASQKGDSDLFQLYLKVLATDKSMYDFISWNVVVYANLFFIKPDLERLAESFKADDREFTGRDKAEELLTLMRKLADGASKKSGELLKNIDLNVPITVKRSGTSGLTIAGTNAFKNEDYFTSRTEDAIELQKAIQIVNLELNSFLDNAFKEGIMQTADAIQQFFQARGQGRGKGPKASRQQVKPKGKTESKKNKSSEKKPDEKKNEEKKQPSGKYLCTGPCYYYRVDDKFKGIEGSVTAVGYGNSEVEASNAAQKNGNDQIKALSATTGVRYNKRHCNFTCKKVR